MLDLGLKLVLVRLSEELEQWDWWSDIYWAESSLLQKGHVCISIIVHLLKIIDLLCYKSININMLLQS